MRTRSSPGLSFLALVVAVALLSGCQRIGLQMRSAIPLEDGGYYTEGGRGYSGAPAPGGRYVNPPINIPRSVPPGSAVRYNSVPNSGRLIAMTYDDGPHPSHTPRLLDILAQRNIKATFYVVGNRVQSHPHIVARMIREGHEVANHSWDHSDFTKLSDAATRSQLQRTAQAIHRACGIYPRTYRPPYGAITKRQRQWIHREFGYPTIMWNVDPKDWQRPGPSVVASRLVSGTRSGSILLAHDIHGGTVSAMPGALDQLLARGFRFVTVTQLINAVAFAEGGGEEGEKATENVAAAGDDGGRPAGSAKDGKEPVPPDSPEVVEAQGSGEGEEAPGKRKTAPAKDEELSDSRFDDPGTIAEALNLVDDSVVTADRPESEQP